MVHVPGTVTHRMVKTKEFPQHHSIHWNFNLSHDDTGLTKRATILPIAWNDDALIATTVDTNPRHANFAESTNGQCSPESKVFSISAKLQANFTKGAWNTDRLRQLKVQIIPIACAFEDIDAADELSSVTVGAALELTDEDTTNNTFPIYNDVVITATAGQQVDMGASQLGLTATTALEYVTFDMNQLFDLLKFGTNKGKLASCIGGIITHTLTFGGDMKNVNRAGKQANQLIAMKIRMPPKAKFMNRKTFFGLLIRIPTSGTESNYGEAADTTAIDHITFDFRAHYLEWNAAHNHELTG